jgi:hypothetical protein
MPSTAADRPGDDSGTVKVLASVDDRPPVTVIHAGLVGKTEIVVRGTASDNGDIVRVLVNGLEARPIRTGYLEWQASLPPPAGRRGSLTLTAFSEDAAGNRRTATARLESKTSLRSSRRLSVLGSEEATKRGRAVSGTPRSFRR